MSLDYYGIAGWTYKSTLVTYGGTATAQSIRDTAAADSGYDPPFALALKGSALWVARRVIIRNMSAANDIFVAIVTKGTEAEAAGGAKIPIPAGEAIDTYGMLQDITDLLVTAVSTDVIHVFAMGSGADR